MRIENGKRHTSPRPTDSSRANRYNPAGPLPVSNVSRAPKGSNRFLAIGGVVGAAIWVTLQTKGAFQRRFYRIEVDLSLPGKRVSLCESSALSPAARQRTPTTADLTRCGPKRRFCLDVTR